MCSIDSRLDLTLTRSENMLLFDGNDGGYRYQASEEDEEAVTPGFRHQTDFCVREWNPNQSQSCHYFLFNTDAENNNSKYDILMDEVMRSRFHR